MNTPTMRNEFLPHNVLESINRVFEHGAPKHGALSWKSIDVRDPKGVDHQVKKALGHIYKWQEIEVYDIESGELHLTHAAARLIIAIDMLLRESDGPERVEGAGEDVTQTSTVSDYLQKEVAAWKKKTGRD